MNEYVDLGPLVFLTDFDSSNLQSAELVPRLTQESFNYHAPDYEVNILTKSDCHGTSFQNGNRTWFSFGVRGCRSSLLIKFNILNLNKQVKLFLQGMQPVHRVMPHKPLWERIRDKLIVNEKEDHVCSISFRQRLPEDLTGTMHIAFTYPFSHTDLSDFLHTVDLSYSETIRLGRVPFDVSPSPSRAENILSTASLIAKENEIYYHRECVCLSLEGRRVELITITSLHGISHEREDRLINLFPIVREERPFKFPEKKVVFLSARVHPGETPSTFVLHGVFKFLMEPRDPRAIILRRLFVFKFMPMLNPDGVSRGHYRTDPRGVNLNRVYLQPSPLLHPSIYAAKKLLLYYHHRKDSPDDYKYEADYDDSSENSVDKKLVLKENYSSLEEQDSANVSQSMAPSTSATSFSTNLIDLSSANPKSKAHTIKSSLCAGCVTVMSSNILEPKNKRRPLKCSESMLELDSDSNSQLLRDDADINMAEPGSHSQKLDTFLVESEDSHQCTFESCDEDSILDITDVKAGKDCPRLLLQHQLTTEMSSPSTKLPKSIRQSRQRERRTSLQTEKEDLPKSSVKSTGTQQRKKRRLKQRNSSTSALNTAVSYKTSNIYTDSSSGLFLYVDMHGHATKRGIFMYGNHFSDIMQQAECMLLPRLMAMNCQHFDFSACNFTERLMNMKDRRDGASREGSGRVAVLKHTGLIRSYTLECNYNTGRLVNHVSNRPSSYGFNDPPMNPSPHPPKFTPELFEAAGKALAESILDLTSHNPWSRIGSTDFRSLEGMRRWLLKRLQNSPDYKQKNPSSRTSSSMTGVLSSSLPGFDLPLDVRARTRTLKGSTSSIRKGGCSKIPERPTVGPLVPKKENQNSSTSLVQPSGSKSKGSVTDKGNPKTKSKVSTTSNKESSVQPKGSITKIFKVKRVPSRKKSSKARLEKPESKNTLPN